MEKVKHYYEKEMYRSFDNKLFETETECHEYEEKHKARKDEFVSKVTLIKSSPRCNAPFGYTSFGEYSYYDWYKPMTIDEINLINEYADFLYGDESFVDLGEDDIGKWCCLIDDRNRGVIDVYHDVLNSSLDIINKFIKTFENEINQEDLKWKRIEKD